MNTKQAFLLFICCFIYFHSHVNGQSIFENYGGRQYETGQAMALDKRKNIYLLGNYQDTVQIRSYTSIPLIKSRFPLNRLILSKHSPTGHLEMIVEPIGYCIGNDLAVDSSGNIYITGFYLDSIRIGGMALHADSFASRYFLAKLNSRGQPLWLRDCKHIYKNQTFIYSSGGNVRISKKGNIYVVGDYFGMIQIGSDTMDDLSSATDFLVKYDSAGNVLWSTTGKIDYFEIDSKENYTIGWSQYFIRKFDDAGGILWTANSAKYLYGMATDGSGNIYAASNGLCKFSSADGSLIWQKPYNGSGIEDIAVDSSGHLIVAFGQYDTIHYRLVYVNKYDLNGNFSGQVVWGQKTDTGRDHLLFCTEIMLDNDGFIYLTGQWGTQDSSLTSCNFSGKTLTSLGIYDVIFIKASNELLSLPAKPDPSPGSLVLYPNPFDNYLHILLPSSNYESTIITIYNINGQEVFYSDAGLLQANTGIDTRDWPPGIYFIKVSGNKLSLFSKIVKY